MLEAEWQVSLAYLNSATRLWSRNTEHAICGGRTHHSPSGNRIRKWFAAINTKSYDSKWCQAGLGQDKKFSLPISLRSNFIISCNFIFQASTRILARFPHQNYLSISCFQNTRFILSPYLLDLTTPPTEERYTSSSPSLSILNSHNISSLGNEEKNAV